MDLSSPPLMKSHLKSHLTAEQSWQKWIELSKKKIFYSQRQRKSHYNFVGVVLCDIIKSHFHQIGNPQIGKQYHRDSPIGMRVLNRTSGSPASGYGIERQSPQCFWFRRTVVLEYNSTRGLWERETPLLEDAHSFSCAQGSRVKQWHSSSLG